MKVDIEEKPKWTGKIDTKFCKLTGYMRTEAGNPSIRISYGWQIERPLLAFPA